MTEPASDQTVQQAIHAFWETVPPIWHAVRSQVHRRAIENHNLTVDQFHVLRRVHTGIDSASELARAKHISRAAISRSIDVLTNKGLIVGTRDPCDRRHVHLALTAQGETLVETIFGQVREWMTGRLATLDDDELESISQALTVLKKTLR